MLDLGRSWRASRQSGAALLIGSTVTAVMVLVAIAASLWQYRQEVEARALLIGQAIVASVQGQLRAQFDRHDTALRLVIANFEDPTLRMLDDGVWQLLLSNIQKSDPGIISITIVNAGGRVLARQGPASDIDFSGAEFVKAHADADRGLVIGDPIVGEDGSQTITLSRRMVRGDGAFSGVAALVIDLSAARGAFRSIPMGPSDSMTVVSGSGRIIARQPTLTSHGDAGVDLSRNTNFQRMQHMGHGSFVSRSSLDGTERLFTFDKAEETGLLVAVGLATKSLYGNWTRQSLLIGGLALVISVALVFAAVMLAREARLRMAAQNELERQARTDYLTGLPNRRQFEASLDREWRRAVRTRSDLALILLDADHFKQLNDRHGHAVGDQMLKLVADALRACARRPGDLPARIGGEEFAMLLPDTTAAGAAVVAERIRNLLRERILLVPGGTPAVTLSAGVADTIGRSAGPAAAHLIAAADAALYRAKELGRDRVECATSRRANSPIDLPAGVTSNPEEL